MHKLQNSFEEKALVPTSGRGRPHRTFSAVCSCGHKEKAQTQFAAEARIETHAEFPHRTV